MPVTIAILVTAAFMSGAVSGVFVLLVAGIRAGDRAAHLAAAPHTHVDAITRQVLGVGVRSGSPAGHDDTGEH